MCLILNSRRAIEAVIKVSPLLDWAHTCVMTDEDERHVRDAHVHDARDSWLLLFLSLSLSHNFSDPCFLE